MEPRAQIQTCSRCGPVALMLLSVVRAAASPPDSEPWLAGAFAADATEVARAAAEVDAVGGDAVGGDVVMLFRDDRFDFDAGGRMTHTRRWVYRVITPSGADDWSVSEVGWSPWHQARPEIRVRVVDAGGGQRWLDSEAASDLTAEEAGLGGERRLLRVPLPVTVGAVVEELVVSREIQPLFSAGASFKHVLTMPVPVRRGRLTLAAPEALPLRYGVRKLALEHRQKVVDGRVTVTFDYADLPAARPIEAGLPADQPRYPHVVFSTGDNWASVAGAYARAVDQRLAESDPLAVLRWLPDRGAGTRLERIAELVAGVRGNVRHQAAELGAGPLVPASPLAVLRRGAGDSKDLAAVLTAALRAEGIPAHLALLRSGYGMDVEPELPGLGRFNHVLVYLPAPKTSAEGFPMWIDPSDRFSRAGELASDRQGRLALIASPESRLPVRTPASRAEDNRTITEIDVYMAEEGPARMVEASTYFGAAERRQRVVTSQIDGAGRRLGYEAYLQAAYRAEALGEVEETAASDLSAHFGLRLEALRAGRGWTAAGEAALAVDLSHLITALPRPLLVAGGPRQGDFVFHEPLVNEWHYRIHLPPKMQARALPEDLSRPLSTGSLVRTVRLEGPMIRADFRLDSGPRRITAEELDAFRDAVQELLREEALVLWFDHRRRRGQDPPGT